MKCLVVLHDHGIRGNKAVTAYTEDEINLYGGVPELILDYVGNNIVIFNFIWVEI